MKRAELLAPAGNLEKLKLAILYGADAVFLGGQNFGLRSGADNFSIDEIKEGVSFAKENDACVYVTTNIYAHEKNFDGYAQYVEQLERVGVRGIIVSDPGYIKICKKHAPKLEIHISTQQSITNLETVLMYEKLGANRTVLARELTFEEIKYITDNCAKEIEVFIHGAVCSSYSGRCTLSNHMTTRDSNRGGCCQSCRWNYQLHEVVGDDIIKTNLNDEETQFSMSAKDMQLLNYIPNIIDSNISSLKIEGRMKSNHYVATVVGVYRTALDTYYADPDNYFVKPEWVEEIKKAEARETYEGALINDFSKNGQIFKDQYRKDKAYDYCGIVKGFDTKTMICKIEQRNYFEIGETIEFFGPNNQRFSQKVDIIYNEEMQEIKKANHPLMTVYLKVQSNVDSSFMLRKQK